MKSIYSDKNAFPLPLLPKAIPIAENNKPGGLTRSRLNALRADTARFKKRLFIHFRCGFKVRAMLTRSGDHVVLSALLIGQLGELIVDTWEGRKLVSSGEVSVRGVYGYV